GRRALLRGKPIGDCAGIKRVERRFQFAVIGHLDAPAALKRRRGFQGPERAGGGGLGNRARTIRFDVAQGVGAQIGVRFVPQFVTWAEPPDAHLRQDQLVADRGDETVQSGIWNGAHAGQVTAFTSFGNRKLNQRAAVCLPSPPARSSSPKPAMLRGANVPWEEANSWRAWEATRCP